MIKATRLLLPAHLLPLHHVSHHDSPDPAQASRNGINCTACVNVPGFGLAGGTCEPCEPGWYADDTMETCSKW
jgi:hypothetical protein